MTLREQKIVELENVRIKIGDMQVFNDVYIEAKLDDAAVLIESAIRDLQNIKIKGE